MRCPGGLICGQAARTLCSMIEIVPEVLVTDTLPLIHLAAIGHLSLLNELGRVTIVDMVRHEATDDRRKPFAPEIAAWIEDGQRPGANHPVAIAETEIGRAFRLARKTDPDFAMSNGGGIALVEWLARTLHEAARPALVVYEDKKVPRLIALEGMESIVYTATTRAVLILAEKRGLIGSEERLWNQLIGTVPTASPENRIQAIKPRGARS